MDKEQKNSVQKVSRLPLPGKVWAVREDPDLFIRQPQMK